MGYIHQSHAILTANLRSRFCFVLFLLFYERRIWILEKENNSSINTQQIRLDLRVESMFPYSRDVLFFFSVLSLKHITRRWKLIFPSFITLWLLLALSFLFPKGPQQTLENTMVNTWYVRHFSHSPDRYSQWITESWILSHRVPMQLRSFLAHRAPNSTNN